MATYIATLEFARSYERTIEADSLEEAQQIAQQILEAEQNLTDINERESVSLIDLEEEEN